MVLGKFALKYILSVLAGGSGGMVSKFLAIGQRNRERRRMLKLVKTEVYFVHPRYIRKFAMNNTVLLMRRSAFSRNDGDSSTYK